MAQQAVALAEPLLDPVHGGSGAGGGIRRAAVPALPTSPKAARRRAYIDLIISSDDEEVDFVPSPKKRKVEETGDSGGGVAAKGADGDQDEGKGKEWAPRPVDFLDNAGDLVMDDFAFHTPMAAGPSNRAVLSPQVAPSDSLSPPDATQRDESVPAATQDDEAVAIVCSILPDVLPSYVRDLLKLEVCGPGNVELVVEMLLSSENGYPKRQVEERAKGKGKRKRKGKEKASEGEEPDARDEDEEAAEVERNAKRWLDTSGKKFGGRAYEDAALSQLYIDFPTIQQVNIKKLFQNSRSFYAPAYLAAEKALKQTEAERGYKLMAGGGKARADKGKGRASEEYELERKWVVEELGRYRSVQQRAADLEKQLEQEIASGAFFECGCCFADCALSVMTTCDLGCSFCKDCARMNAESQIGMRKYILPCMDTSGCTATFSEREAERFLSKKTIAALHKIRQEKEVDGAGIEGLEQCPFCPFAYIIENPDERLFHCQRDDCRIKDHLPKTCKEVDEDAIGSAVNRVAEAMSAALIRRCPKEGCGEPYIKDNGTCNKIVCSSCRTISCYICNQVIKGYEHFTNAGSNAPNGSEAGATCVLWDDSDARNYQEVEAARIAAEEAARKENAGADDHLKKLAMDKPGAAPHVVAHLPAPRVAAYEALVAGARAGVNAGLEALGGRWAAAPAPARLPPPPLPIPNRRAPPPPAPPARKRARFAHDPAPIPPIHAQPRLPPVPAVPPVPHIPHAYIPAMPDYAAYGVPAVAAPAIPVGGGARGINLGGLARAGHRAPAEPVDPAAVNARWQERKRLAEEARKAARLAATAAEDARRKRRRDADEAREAKRKRTSGGRKG
ncbi:hypothetical protein JCM11251_002121 [Rhodosporidiobolus azoricus]